MHSNRFPVSGMVLVFLLSAGSAGWTQPTRIEGALQELEQAPPLSPASFEFVVVADSNTLKPIQQADVYKQSIKEWNVLRPNFVVQAGDIVLGGAAEGVPAQWDFFDETIRVCEPPYLPLPGNHDISDEATEAIWRERIGPTHYSFHHGNSFFIALNSEEVGAVDRISDEQVAWLEEQLASTKAKNIFVFLHKPYFNSYGEPDAAEESWEKKWSNVADAFRGHPVRVVFAGHRHVYRDCGVCDGVRYVICGGASVYGMGGNEEEGSFNHYLLVRVRGEEVSWAVIKPYSVLPENAVTSARIDELHNIRNKWVAAGEIFAPMGEGADQDVTMTITNSGDTTMKSSAAWECPRGWIASPMETDYEVAPQNSVDLTFRMKWTEPGEARFPVPTFRTLYTQTQHGPPVDVELEMRFVPTMSALRAPGAMAIDAALDEWNTANWRPLTYANDFDADDADDLDCDLAFYWDDDFLYLAVKTHDNEFHQPYAGDIVWAADNVEMFLDAWSWGLTLTERGPEVFLYWGVDVSGETVNTDVKLAVKRDGTSVIYEAAFPVSHLTPLELKPGATFRFDAFMNDLDPSGPLKKRHWLRLVPGAVIPGNPTPRVRVILE